MSSELKMIDYKVLYKLLEKYDIEMSDFVYSARSTKPAGKEDE